MHDMNQIVGTQHILFLTLDTLRFDVAQRCLAENLTPNLASILPGNQWEERHTPGSFTYAAHHSFFAGFLPTPVTPDRHPRLFALRFPGSETTTSETCVLDAPDVVHGLASRGYHTLCIGGVGFFNKLTPLGCVLPDLFQESHWSPELGVTNPHSFENQIAVLDQSLAQLSRDQLVFLFVNVSAIHQPNCFYLEGSERYTLESHAAALSYVDGHLPSLFELMKNRGPTFCILCSDHGTAYGEDGYHGHRLAHPVVWTVPYAELILS